MSALPDTPLPPYNLRLGRKELSLLVLAIAALAVSAIALPSMVPVLAGALVAAAMPRADKAYDGRTRLVLAVMAALLTFFVVRVWPTAMGGEAAAPPPESPTLLSWIIL